MAIYTITNLKARFNTYIKMNFLQLITGPILNGILHDIADSINSWLANYVLKADSKAGRANVTDAGTPIVFATPFPEGTDYIIIRNCQNADGDVGYIITNRSISGFTVTSVVNALFEYKCVKI